ncbi:MAG: hypothetical protein K0B07_05775 [DPANN group archaeon]|nr:hypothetical protein [DPANN group archaeon]
MNTTQLIKTIESFSKVSPTLDNMEDMISFKGFLPIQCNTNIDEETKEISWGQLVVSYKSDYTRLDDKTGEALHDNATHKKLIIKFPKSFLKNNGVTANEFKRFFDDNFVKKARLILPVSDERPSFDNKIPMKNQSEVTISNAFDLRGFINSIKYIEDDKAKKSL